MLAALHFFSHVFLFPGGSLFYTYFRRRTVPRITDDWFCGEAEKDKEKRISPRMVQAGNANRRDNPYDRKIRPQTYPVRQMDYQSMEILAFSLVPISA